MAHIFQINISSGGVPKLAAPLAQAHVTTNGIVGDKQRHLDVHGGPERAVCLYSLERILALQQEGHPVFPGAMGENITLSGLDWSQLSPGMRLRLGEEVELEITRPTTPCTNLRPYFLDGDYSRVSPNKHPGWSRFYARVLRAGKIVTGDRVEIVATEP
ncbi:MAG: MOSC domain-containing protein [Anaerolineae bacterium]|nr:MAG: MOSC domain-containing protein [Anaerolineae bacterium]